MLRDNCLVGAMIRWEIIQGAIVWEAIVQEAILPGGSCQDTDDCAIYERENNLKSNQRNLWIHLECILILADKQVMLLIVDKVIVIE